MAEKEKSGKEKSRDLMETDAQAKAILSILNDPEEIELEGDVEKSGPLPYDDDDFSPFPSPASPTEVRKKKERSERRAREKRERKLGRIQIAKDNEILMARLAKEAEEKRSQAKQQGVGQRPKLGQGLYVSSEVVGKSAIDWETKKTSAPSC